MKSNLLNRMLAVALLGSLIAVSGSACSRKDDNTTYNQSNPPPTSSSPSRSGSDMGPGSTGSTPPGAPPSSAPSTPPGGSTGSGTQ